MIEMPTPDETSSCQANCDFCSTVFDPTYDDSFNCECGTICCDACSKLYVLTCHGDPRCSYMEMCANCAMDCLVCEEEYMCPECSDKYDQCCQSCTREKEEEEEEDDSETVSTDESDESDEDMDEMTN